MRDLRVLALTAGYAASLASAHRRFVRALREPERVQSARLMRRLRDDAATVLGRRFDFAGIGSVQSFQRRVPVLGYEEIQAEIERAAAGDPAVLTREPVRLFELTSGSTAANKLIPFTPGFLREIAAATEPWLYDLYTGDPRLLGTRAYWAISPAVRRERVTSGGLSIGLDDDTEYFGAFGRWALRRLVAVPAEVARAASMPVWREQTLRALLEAEDLGLVSVWSPSFFGILLDAFEADASRWLEGLSAHRRAGIERRRRAGAGWVQALWPRLVLVSAWADGPAAAGARTLRARLGGVTLQPKGLLATEGALSIPLRAETRGSVLAVASHFLEFVDLEQPEATPVLAHALRVGATYTPLLTTAGGLTRYPLRDAVSCVGRHLATPVIRFVGKLDRVSDRAGEKLAAPVVEAALQAASAAAGLCYRFAMLAPEARGRHRWRYRAFVETDADRDTRQRFVDALERELRRGHAYDHSRALGQLEPLALAVVRDAWARYGQAKVNDGMRLGDVKPTPLDDRDDWATRFGVDAEEVLCASGPAS